ncbi:MAG: hypothetical protein Q7S39_01905 [Ignavibacteria bacterium]|nr:hypothetical protein [Ignavibacteria bacterium]
MKILIISALLGFPVMAQTFLSVDSSDDKVIEVNLTQRNALAPANLACFFNEIKIVDNPPYLIFKEKSEGICSKRCEEKVSL